MRPSVSTWSHESLQGAFVEVSHQYNLPKEISVLVFIDGYDELASSEKEAGLSNLVNDLWLSGAVHAKLIVTCRANTVAASEVEARFNFNGQLETRHFLPFTVDQLLTYLKHELSWEDATYQEYQKTLADAESVRTVLRNAFVLYLVKGSWERLSKKPVNLWNRWNIYEGFIAHTITTQKPLLSENLQKRLQGKHSDLLTSYQMFGSSIAFSAFQKNSITLDWVEALGISNWTRLQAYAEQEAQEEYGQRQEKLAAKLQAATEKAATDSEKNKLTRRSLLTEEDYVSMKIKRIEQFESELPMKIRGEGAEKRYEYSHKSLFEYFMAKRLTMLKDLKNNDRIIEEGIRLLATRPIQAEKEAITFFEEGWGSEEVNQLQEPLFEIIKASRHDSSKTQASANAATLLAAAHVPFSGRDLSGLCLQGAVLSNALLSHTCFYKADLQDVILHSAWLDSADLRAANLVGVDFGEFPSLQFESKVGSVSYSKDGMQMAIGLSNGDIEIYQKEHQSYKPITTLKGYSESVRSVTYSPDGKQLAAGSNDHSVFVWAQQSAACLPAAPENWQLICRFETSHRLSAHGAFLQGANISENNLALLKQKGAHDDQDLPGHAHTEEVVINK